MSIGDHGYTLKIYQVEKSGKCEGMIGIAYINICTYAIELVI